MIAYLIRNWQTVLASSIAALLVAFIVVSEFRALSQDNPLRLPSPQKVLNANKTVALGEAVLVQATKCNDADAPIEVVGEVHWRRVDNITTQVIHAVTGSSRREPGCKTFPPFYNPMPSGVSLGLWIIEGSEQAFINNRLLGVRVFWTEQFRVVE